LCAAVEVWPGMYTPTASIFKVNSLQGSIVLLTSSATLAPSPHVLLLHLQVPVVLELASDLLDRRCPIFRDDTWVANISTAQATVANHLCMMHVSSFNSRPTAQAIPEVAEMVANRFCLPCLLISAVASLCPSLVRPRIHCVLWSTQRPR
jgi:hypothetical protein